MNRNLVLFPLAGLAAIGGAWLWYGLGDDSMDDRSTARPAPVRIEQTEEENVDQAMTDLLSPSVKTIVSTENVALLARKRAIEILPRNLESPDLAALMDFMAGEAPEETSSAEWHALVDQLMNALQQQEKPPVALTPTLIRMFEESDDPTIQDYAIQYLRSWYADRGDFYRHEPDHDARGLILKTLIEAASHTDRPYSGTAIMALHDALDSSELASEPETVEQLRTLLPDYEAVLVKVVEDPETDKHCRISTLQICAMRGMTGILPTARTLAADPNTDPNIRISAIAAIGQLGSLGEDGELLKSLSNSGLRLSYAAEPALQRLARK